MNKCYKWNTTG